MILIFAIYFIYFLLFQLALSSTKEGPKRTSIVEALTTTLGTAFGIFIMQLPLLVVIWIGLFFTPSFIPSLSFFSLIQILFLFSSILFLYEVTIEQFIIRIIQLFTTSHTSFLLMLFQFFINIWVFFFCVFYFTPASPWPILTIIIVSGIDAWINYFFDELTD
ncbi:MAG: hypothetical protein ACI35O_05860 [Bacillaceae bacterium]